MPEVIKLASAKNLEDVLKAASKCKGTVQLLEPSMVISRKHLLGAYLNARLSFKEHTNIAKSMAMEMLLFASMRKQIKDAIPVIGAKDPQNFVAFADNTKSFNHIATLLTDIREFKPATTESIKTAKNYSIDARNAKELDTLVLQKMAVARISD